MGRPLLAAKRTPEMGAAQLPQLFDYFVCPRPMIEAWAEALAAGDEERQGGDRGDDAPVRAAEEHRAGRGLAAACAAGDDVDAVAAVAAATDLVRAVDPTEGPWVMAFRPSVVEAVARLTIDWAVVARGCGTWPGSRAGPSAVGCGSDGGCRRGTEEMCELAVGRRFWVFVASTGDGPRTSPAQQQGRPDQHGTAGQQRQEAALDEVDWPGPGQCGAHQDDRGPRADGPAELGRDGDQRPDPGPGSGPWPVPAGRSPGCRRWPCRCRSR